MDWGRVYFRAALPTVRRPSTAWSVDPETRKLAIDLRVLRGQMEQWLLGLLPRALTTDEPLFMGVPSADDESAEAHVMRYMKTVVEWMLYSVDVRQRSDDASLILQPSDSAFSSCYSRPSMLYPELSEESEEAYRECVKEFKSVYLMT